MIRQTGLVLERLLIAENRQALDRFRQFAALYLALAGAIVGLAGKGTLGILSHGHELCESRFGIALAIKTSAQTNAHLVGQFRRWFLIESLFEQFDGRGPIIAFRVQFG